MYKATLVQNKLPILDVVRAHLKNRYEGVRKKVKNYKYIDGDIHTETVCGFRLDFHATDQRDRSHLRRLFSTDRNELPLLENVAEELKSDDVFWDIGGYIGVYSVLASSLLPAAQICTFEPIGENVERIQNNLRLNRAHGSTMLQVGITNETGTQQLRMNPEYRMGSLSVDPEHTSNALNIDVDTGDNIVADDRCPPPTVIKMNIEGVELDAVKGMSTVLQTHVRAIYIEVHNILTPDQQQTLRDLLTEYGFTVKIVYEEPQSYYLKGTK